MPAATRKALGMSDAVVNDLVRAESDQLFGVIQQQADVSADRGRP
jgi:hypothetical protein